MIEGFKITRTDGSTHNGYRWPLPMPGERVIVEADPNGQPFTTHDACPTFDGDGLCVAKTARGAASSGIGLASCIGLLLKYDPADVLAEDAHKVRVSAVTVTGVFDVLSIIRSGLAANLRYANLSAANLNSADLSYADLSYANLNSADLNSADLSAANLRYADLSGANLRYADLSGANLRYADLTGANLRYADLTGADLTGAIGVNRG